MWVVVTGCLSSGFNWFGPFDDRNIAETWARAYALQHGIHAKAYLLCKPFFLG